MIDSQGIAPVDIAAAQRARLRIDALTKPPGSLGRIESLAVQLAAICGHIPARPYTSKAVVVGAADHGVAVEGVSAYPREVTSQMVEAFLAGHAAVNAFARVVSADVYVADFGVIDPPLPRKGLLGVSVRGGTRNLAREAALTSAEVGSALSAGARVFQTIIEFKDYDVIALGDMGIANSTSAAAMVAAFCGATPECVVGRGTGIDDPTLRLKTEIVRQALQRVEAGDWRSVAREVGGLEIVGLAGTILAAARHHLPVILDGFIVSAAALLASEISRNVPGYCIAAHLSTEPGHRIALESLKLSPLLSLDMRLGEATGAVLALPLVEAATRMISEMKSFDEAGVSSRSI
jgi:nicotinate-nucleotide--dimethylbenzimidazole phosphoribosyltransferase